MALLLAAFYPAAWQAHGAQMYQDGAVPFETGASAPGPAQAELWSATPGRIWAEVSLADRGLGYSGSYFTLGGKTRLWNDFFDGRWLLEAQGNVSLEEGGFFSNLGIERVFSLTNAGADIVVGGWFDYDSDQQGNFAHTFSQFAVNGAIKTRYWDIVGNGYFPIGTTDYAQGDPTGVDCFFLNNIVLQAGIDSALRGFDGMFRHRPEALGMVNGTVEIGGYAYGSDLVDDFGGVRGRVGIQALQGMMLAGEVNYDNRFDVTSVVQIGWQFGANARGNEYAGLGRDLEPTMRNDHIVRYQQDLILAIDPDTGLPYNVFHVDNLADPAFANGTVETPFTHLLQAQLASGADDIIFVREGDGTDRNYDAGIVLKDGQLLLGDGVRHIIPIQNGQFFVLCNDIDGDRPRISNDLGNIVTLANRNTVRGVILEGNGAAVNGISGNAFPFGPPITDGVIEDTTITDPVLNGILLDTIAGDWRFARNDISGAGFGDGISILNACDPTSDFTFEDNLVNNNSRDGIHMETYDGATFTFTRNTTNGNGRDGVHLEDFKNTSGLGGEFLFAGPVALENGRHGLSMENADGDVRILNANLQDNFDTGLRLVNVTNSQPGDATFIGTTTGGTSTFNGNGTGIHIRLDQPGLVQRATITDSTINNNATIGLLSEASGTGVQLTTNVVDNLSVSGNGGTGMRFTSLEGAFHRVLVENTFSNLPMAGNGAVAGNGIDLLVGDNTPGMISAMDATLRNISITGTGGLGLFVDVEFNGQLDLVTENVTINGASSGILALVDTTPTGALSSLLFNNVDILNVGSDGVSLNVGDDTLLDFSFINGSIRDDYDPLALSDNGFEVNVDGNASTFARIVFQNNLIDRVNAVAVAAFAFDGVEITSAGSSHVFVTLDGNRILNNGPGSDITNLAYFDGIDISVLDTSTLSAIVTNNTVTGNFEASFDLNHGIGASTANIFMGFNAFDSDAGEDGPIPITSNLQEMIVTNGVASTTCLSMSNNFFASPAFVDNLSAAGSFKLELDGLTNGLGQPVILAPVMLVPFGSTCQPAITAESALFLLNGFPPP
jgi:hypothetical protein